MFLYRKLYLSFTQVIISFWELGSRAGITHAEAWSTKVMKDFLAPINSVTSYVDYE